MQEGPVHKAIDQLHYVREAVESAEAQQVEKATSTTATPPLTTSTTTTTAVAVPTSQRKCKIDDEHCCLLFATILDQIKSYKLSTIEVKHVEGTKNKADGLTKPLDILPIFKNTILFKRSDVVGE